ncbi:MAG: hypothetical protein FWF26_02190 [Treponema sp.]|nr:hypothetical protein [Treponema sp.]
METNTTPDYEQGLTFEQVWASIKELAEQQKKYAEQQKDYAEQQKKYVEEAAEQQKKYAEEEAERKKQMEEYQKKTERIVRRNSKQMGDLHNRFGQLAEHLVAPNINKRFNEYGYHFGAVSPGGHRIEDEKGKIRAEIDILLENGETIMAVEVKTKPTVNDVEHHIKRLEILRDHRRGINDKRKIEGAIAGAIFGMEEKKATLDAGLYVIEQSGDTMKIEVPEGFIPRQW